MKKGAIHIDWVISVGIFLVYLIALLILIKPSYKSAYEGDVLTKMIKDEFLKQNKIDAGFVVFKAEDCKLEEGKDVIEELNKKLPNIDKSEINIKSIPNRATFYKANFLRDQDLSSDSEDLKKCEIVEVGEVMNYTGLKGGLNFNVDNIDEYSVAFSKKFPSSRKYKIIIYPGENKIIPRKDNKPISMGEPSSDDSVYVLDWSAAKLNWDNFKNEIIRDNIIINIQVW